MKKSEVKTPELPTLEEARKMLDFIKEPRGYDIVIISPAVPKILSNGFVSNNKKDYETAQMKDYSKGMLVVFSPYENSPEVRKNNPHAVFAGDIITVNDKPSDADVITTEVLHEGLDIPDTMKKVPEMYQSFIWQVQNSNHVSLVLKKRRE